MFQPDGNIYLRSCKQDRDGKCIAMVGKRNGFGPLLSDVEKALEKTIIGDRYERLTDMRRSIGDSRGSNPCFVDED